VFFVQLRIAVAFARRSDARLADQEQEIWSQAHVAWQVTVRRSATGDVWAERRKRFLTTWKDLN